MTGTVSHIAAHVAIIPMLAMMIAIAACDTGVDRFSDDGADLAFNLTGFLATESDTQFVRVQRVRPTVDREGNPSLDATATLSNLVTGESRVMSDSLIRLDDGDQDHLLFAPLQVNAGHSYELRVVGSSGEVTVATTTVPRRPPTTVVPAATFGSLITQEVTWDDLTRTPEHAVVVYEIARSSEHAPVAVEIPYTLRGRLEREGWTAIVRLSDDQRIVRQELDILQSDNNAVFFRISMRLRLPSNEWSQLASPQNISGGLGFFGSVGVFTDRWIVDSETIAAMGFVNGQQP